MQQAVLRFSCIAGKSVELECDCCHALADVVHVLIARCVYCNNPLDLRANQWSARSLLGTSQAANMSQQ